MDVKDALRRMGGKGKRRQKAKGLPKRTGSPTAHERRLRAYARLPQKKLRRVLQQSGRAAALAYAQAHGLSLDE